MPKKEVLDTWLDRACGQVGYTVEGARHLWIGVRCGDDQAKVTLYRLLRDNPSIAPVFEHFRKETERLRRDRGLKNPKSFGRPERTPDTSFASMQEKRVKGVSVIHQGGLPSLGRRK